VGCSTVQPKKWFNTWNDDPNDRIGLPVLHGSFHALKRKFLNTAQLKSAVIFHFFMSSWHFKFGFHPRHGMKLQHLSSNAKFELSTRQFMFCKREFYIYFYTNIEKH
jgi:hypothetical protein